MGVEDYAAMLARAERDRSPIEPLSTMDPGLDVADAYRIQLAGIERRVAAGERVVGHKVGLSSPAMQRMMGVHEPDYGHLLETMRLTGPVAARRYCTPRIEVEVAFLLGADIDPAASGVKDVLAATRAVYPAIELIDSRIRDWRIGIVDTIADNASSAGFLLGDTATDPSGVDLTAIGARLYRGGELVESGRSDAVLGDPAIAVGWLARTVAEFGVRLRAGDLVLPGSCTKAVDVAAGQRYVAAFDTLGEVTIEFEEQDSEQ